MSLPGFRPSCRASFSVAVHRVFLARTEPQVGRVATRRVVARMANHHPGRNRAVDQFVDDTMRGPVGPVGPKRPITSSPKASAEPRPATVGGTAVDLGPEATGHVARFADCVVGTANDRTVAASTETETRGADGERSTASTASTLNGHFNLIRWSATPPAVGAARGHFAALILRERRAA